MNKPILALAALCIAVPARAQMMVSGLAAPASTADLSAVVATIPVPASSAPTAESIVGAAGSTMTFRRGDAVQPRITRMLGPDSPCLTNASGLCMATWTATSGGTPGVLPIPMISSTSAAQAPQCLPVDGTITTTGATIKCFTTQTVTVGALGASVAPITTAAANLKVMVLVIPPAI